VAYFTYSGVTFGGTQQSLIEAFATSHANETWISHALKFKVYANFGLFAINYQI